MKTNIPISFEQASYNVQVRRLRSLVTEALKFYKLNPATIKFINHGENATFKITTKNGSQFLFRIHRKDYHTETAIRDELLWLEALSQHGLEVPRPVRTKRGLSLIEIDYPSVGLRHCDVFHWIEGRFISKSISESDMFKIGVLLAKVQKVGSKLSGKNRRYWTSEGLLGEKPKFGTFDQVSGLRKDEQKKLVKIRKDLLSKLKTYEKLFPKKMGMIHADLHFGNLLKTKAGNIAAIDFDDSGYGFYLYDLAVPLIGAEYHLQYHKKFRSYPSLKKAMLDGYASITPLTIPDLAILQDLIVARKLLFIGWLQSRSDNPKLRGRVIKYARETLRYIAKPNL